MNANLNVSAWNQSYSRKENFIFYPKEEVVKFLNRFVRKRYGIEVFSDLLALDEGRLKGIDFGCGIGRQTILLSEFGIDAWGCDISTSAIEVANELKNNLSSVAMGSMTFFHIEGAKLPYERGFFDIGICDSVLDSMQFDTAKVVINELDRTISKLLYISLISANCHGGKADEVFVNTLHENGTIQSYFDFNKVEELIKGTNWRIKWYNLIAEKGYDDDLINERYHIVLEKRLR